MDFHPHLHALVADGLFVRSGLFYVLPDAGLKPLEELFRARVITLLVDKGLLPPERANMLRGWVHSGFNVPCYEREYAPIYGTFGVPHTSLIFQRLFQGLPDDEHCAGPYRHGQRRHVVQASGAPAHFVQRNRERIRTVIAGACLSSVDLDEQLVRQPKGGPTGGGRLSNRGALHHLVCVPAVAVCRDRAIQLIGSQPVRLEVVELARVQKPLLYLDRAG